MILITQATIVTQDIKRQIIENGYILIEKDRIKEIGSGQPPRDLKRGASKVISGRGKVVMPGLINAHTHLAMTLLRGYADDLVLEDWWFNYIYPIESKFKRREVYWGSLLGAMEAVKSGTTCLVDFYYFPEEVRRAIQKVGLRANIGLGVLDVKTFAFDSVREILSLAKRIFQKRIFKKKDRIDFSLAPHMFQTTSLITYQRCKKITQKFNLLCQTHLAETRTEVKYVQKKYKKRPVEVLEEIGFLNEKTLLAHSCWLTGKEIKILAQRGASVCHCPISNMKLSSGVMPLVKLLKAGVNVCLGTDGACSNNTLDMFEEMKTAALLHKISSFNPTVASAQTILDMATLNGAKALGLEKEIGSIEKGKKADLIILNFEKPHLQPVYHVVSHLIYAAKGEDVETVIIDGKIILEKKKFVYLNEKEILSQIKKLSSFLIRS